MTTFVKRWDELYEIVRIATGDSFISAYSKVYDKETIDKLLELEATAPPVQGLKNPHTTYNLPGTVTTWGYE